MAVGDSGPSYFRLTIIHETYPHHKRMRRMHKIYHIAFRGTLEAQLAVGGHRVVHEHDVVGQLAVVQNFSMIFAQLTTFCLEAELILKSNDKISNQLLNQGFQNPGLFQSRFRDWYIL